MPRVRNRYRTTNTLRLADRQFFTLFMIITPPDFEVALRTIPRLSKIRCRFSPTLILYANGLTSAQEQLLRRLGAPLPNSFIYSNHERLRSLAPRVGHYFTTPAGNIEFWDGPYENGSQVWNQLGAMNSKYVAIVDADFEIINPDFIYEAIRQLEGDERLAVFSSHHSPTGELCLDSYSGLHKRRYERYDTCFCIYRLSALRNYCIFDYREDESNGEILAYDHSAYLQKELRERFRFTMASCDRRFSNSFIHYGSFSRNKTLRGLKLRFYLLLLRCQKTGLSHRFSRFKTDAIARRLVTVLFGSFLSAYSHERATYNSRSEPAATQPLPRPHRQDASTVVHNDGG